MNQPLYTRIAWYRRVATRQSGNHGTTFVPRGVHGTVPLAHKPLGSQRMY